MRRSSRNVSAGTRIERTMNVSGKPAQATVDPDSGEVVRDESTD